MNAPAQPLVGRDHEQELLGQLLEGAIAGSPGFACVTGEPGIGKTSLLAGVLREAEDRGSLVLRGSGAEFERHVPFGLVLDAFDEYLESLDPHTFSRLAPVDLGELAGVFPALRALHPGTAQPSTAAERFRAHHAVRALIERLAAIQPLVLVLEDLHWADGASLELAAHLLRRAPRGPVLIALTFRTGQVERALEAAIDSPDGETAAVQRIALGPLTRAESELLVAGAGAEERERLYRASGGNPFYLLQLARMGEDGGRDPAGEPGGVPAAVVGAIVGELDGLSPAARHLAEAAAVVGDPFDLDLTVVTANVEETDALAAVDELTARDLVHPAPVPRRFSFRHPLVRRAVYESCAPGVRIAAHERIAAALAAQGAPATVRAHHVEHSAHHGDADAVGVLRAAGEEAARRAPASAARWFGIAIGLLRQSAPPEERVELLTALAGAQAAIGRFEDSRAALLESIALTPEDQESVRVGLIGTCAGIEQLLGHHEEAHTRLAAALGGLSDTASAQAVELMIQLAVGDFYRMDYERMGAWGERALGVAQPLGEAPLTAASTAVLAVARAYLGAVPEAEAYRSQAAALADSLPDDQLGLRLDALANLSAAELYLHRYEAAASHARRGLAIAGATGQADISPFLIPVLCTVLHTTGRIAESTDLLNETVEAARLSGNVQTLGWHLLSQAFTAVAAGDLDLALAVAQESVDLTRDLDDNLVTTFAGLALATALFEKGDAERATGVLVAASGGAELPLVPGGWRAFYFELLTRCRLACGRQAEAEQAAGRAAAAAKELGLQMATAMAHRAEAAVALETEAPAAAAERALDSAAEADEIGARVEAARARTLAGRALASAGEDDRAVAQLKLAAHQLEACGAVRFRQEADQELRRLGRHVHRRTAPGKANGTGVQKLTQREAEIARLVVERHTNPEIATELFLSVKTIETHMHNIFRKLDVSSRVDVARAVEHADRAP